MQEDTEKALSPSHKEHKDSPGKPELNLIFLGAPLAQENFLRGQPDTATRPILSRSTPRRVPPERR